jgi:hypothetical protein
VSITWLALLLPQAGARRLLLRQSAARTSAQECIKAADKSAKTNPTARSSPSNERLSFADALARKWVEPGNDKGRTPQGEFLRIISPCEAWHE